MSEGMSLITVNVRYPTREVREFRVRRDARIGELMVLAVEHRGDKSMAFYFAGKKLDDEDKVLDRNIVDDSTIYAKFWYRG